MTNVVFLRGEADHKPDPRLPFNATLEASGGKLQYLAGRNSLPLPDHLHEDLVADVVSELAHQQRALTEYLKANPQLKVRLPW